ncbi:MAG: hypothetical protein ACLQFM_10450 [Terriglobales bacterium]|jgi:hypothetical protein
MRAFKVSLNGERVCLAGIGERGVLTAIVTWVAGDRRADLFMEVGGLANEEHLKWVNQKPLRVGDEIKVKIVEVTSVDRPVKKQLIHPAETVKAQKRYVRMLAKQFGWKIQRSQAKSSHRLSGGKA